MAKQANNRGGGGKFRLVIFEGEIAEGGFAEFAQAFQNALRPAAVVQQRPAPSLLPNATPTPSSDATQENGEIVEEVSAEANHSSQAAQRKSREPRQRRITSPEVVNDLELNGDPSWIGFAGAANPSSDIDKFLVVAEWCKRHRGLNEISGDHVFTCFKRVQWSTNKPDFAATLRACKSRKFMGSGAERGFYAINHLGSSRVDDLMKK